MVPPAGSHGRSTLAIAGVLVAAAVVALLFLPDLRAWLAVDRCLDAGGSYDYEAGSCTPAPADPAGDPAATGPATFVNRVWVVERSEHVAPGSLRVFLSDGTIVMADPNATPAFGAWESSEDGMTITEEGRRYAVEILEIDADRFRIRIDGPGGGVEIVLAAADRRGAPGGGAGPLEGTAWLLEELSGADALGGVQATLEFADSGLVGGRASCNRMSGSVTVSGDSIAFGPLVTTRMACPEAVMDQERRYLSGLESAHRFTFEGGALKLHSVSEPLPMRFSVLPDSVDLRDPDRRPE